MARLLMEASLLTEIARKRSYDTGYYENVRPALVGSSYSSKVGSVSFLSKAGTMFALLRQSILPIYYQYIYYTQVSVILTETREILGFVKEHFCLGRGIAKCSDALQMV